MLQQNRPTSPKEYYGTCVKENLVTLQIHHLMVFPGLATEISKSPETPRKYQ